MFLYYKLHANLFALELKLFVCLFMLWNWSLGILVRAVNGYRLHCLNLGGGPASNESWVGTRLGQSATEHKFSIAPRLRPVEGWFRLTGQAGKKTHAFYFLICHVQTWEEVLGKRLWMLASVGWTGQCRLNWPVWVVLPTTCTERSKLLCDIIHITKKCHLELFWG